MNKVVFGMSPQNTVFINEEAGFRAFGNFTVANKQGIKSIADNSLLFSHYLRQTVQSIDIAARPTYVLNSNNIYTLSTLFSQCLAVNRYSIHSQMRNALLRIGQGISTAATGYLSIDFAVLQTGCGQQAFMELYQLFNHINAGDFYGDYGIE